MSHELQLALMDVISPERLEAFSDAYTVLTDLNFNAHTFEIQQVLGLQDGESDNDLLVSRIEDALTVGVWTVLKQMGIEVQDAPLSSLAPLLEGMGLLEHYILPGDLYALTLSNDTPEEIIATLVPYVSILEEDRVFELLTNVQPRAIERIREVLYKAMMRSAEPTGYDVSTLEAKRKLAHLNRLVRQMEGHGAKPPVAKVLADQGIAIGQAIEDLYPLCIELLEENNTQGRLAVDIVSLLLYSDASLDDPVKALTHAIHAFTDEMSEQHQLLQLAKPRLDGL